MGKATGTKGKKPPSKHSRAARRATSPSIDLDKSLKDVRPPVESVDNRPAVLAARHSAGVTKKPKKKVLSSKARRRLEKSMDRAEAVMDRTATKVQRSVNHAKVINKRKKAWEEINKEVQEEIVHQVGPASKLSKKAKAKMEEDAMVAAFYADEDGDAQMEGAGESAEGAEGGQGAQQTQPAQPPFTAKQQEEDEEIL